MVVHVHTVSILSFSFGYTTQPIWIWMSNENSWLLWSYVGYSWLGTHSFCVLWNLVLSVNISQRFGLKNLHVHFQPDISAKWCRHGRFQKLTIFPYKSTVLCPWSCGVESAPFSILVSGWEFTWSFLRTNFQWKFNERTKFHNTRNLLELYS